MIYLYVKTHNKTGLKYLGKTTNKDPHKYPGSGTYWLLHLKKHGYDYTTQILLSTEDKKELKETGIFFSQMWNITESNEWANLKPEEGDGGAPINSNIWVNNNIDEKMIESIDHIPFGYSIGRLKSVGAKISKNKRGKSSWNKGVPMAEKTKKKLSSSKQKYYENKNIVWATNGVEERMIESDEILNQDWYIGRSDSAKERMSNLMWINDGVNQKRIKVSDKIPYGWRKGNLKDQNGVKNPSYGKIWINNGIENRYINKFDKIPTGFVKGRLIVWRS